MPKSLLLAALLAFVPLVANADCVFGCPSAEDAQSPDSGAMDGRWLEQQAAKSLAEEERSAERQRSFDDGVIFGMQQNDADSDRSH